MSFVFNDVVSLSALFGNFLTVKAFKQCQNEIYPRYEIQRNETRRHIKYLTLKALSLRIPWVLFD